MQHDIIFHDRFAHDMHILYIMLVCMFLTYMLLSGRVNGANIHNYINLKVSLFCFLVTCLKLFTVNEIVL